MLHKKMENRRWQDNVKAKRKHDISIQVYGFEWYQCFGAYNKGKIHCSCPMCAGKTSDRKLNHSRGPVSDVHRGSRLCGTHRRLGKNWAPSDARKVMSCLDQLAEYEAV